MPRYFLWKVKIDFICFVTLSNDKFLQTFGKYLHFI